MKKRISQLQEEENSPLLAGSSTSSQPSAQQSQSQSTQKKEPLRLPKRTTKTSQKLTLFPEGIEQEIVVIC
jgi:hypothetical protein